MKKIAVVILNWNGQKLLDQFLPSIIQHSSEATIYVADNASTDHSVEFIKTQFPFVKIIQNTGNFGYAKGYNEALKYVEEDIYALVNSDIEVTKDWLNPIIDLFEKDLTVAIAQPKILDYKNKTMFEYAGAAGGFIDRYGFPFCRGRIFDTLEEDKGQYNDIIDIFWATGACFFIRKDVFRELNGLDSDFFAHQEEIDLCWRAFNKGYQTKYCGLSTVYHLGGGTLKTGSPQKTFLNFRNSLWMMTKNLPTSKLIPILLVRMLLDGIAGIKFLIELKPKHFWAVLKSHYYLYTNLPKYLKNRDLNQKENYYKINSIVYRYFIKNGKIFADLYQN
ncbi:MULTISPECIES: glycosyltransferase family 2 protein [Flavobacterium]|uniref:Glycosyltransferase family 2 protein n=1 Tax=Flavobacterium covae TaxID=2906076 RepID=A0ABW8PIE8_9FLAO|nr:MULTISPECIES: glycosyltransferase family 2 protein [Flavobacterium]OXA72246.1 dTDP-Rha--alpha-D-GlcNAc-pyrophosphate polyprenol alpha-3-L-rhamnosyltransferase [Flavobacterium columnare NBRC 100251 = ATCC 23463]AMA48828.1 glycosyl transferase family 2 [Flavobacterium covae]AND65039.1 glycosyl transferase family 2 [Flavobacterium covae]MCJ1805523.1 glycosyltransferase family 2 protein [Flavobacterium covae]MCJ1807932.1 glycosyltransferase family 2 protein [Flavobacterium covae]